MPIMWVTLPSSSFTGLRETRFQKGRPSLRVVEYVQQQWLSGGNCLPHSCGPCPVRAQPSPQCPRKAEPAKSPTKSTQSATIGHNECAPVRSERMKPSPSEATQPRVSTEQRRTSCPIHLPVLANSCMGSRAGGFRPRSGCGIRRCSGSAVRNRQRWLLPSYPARANQRLAAPP